MPLHAIGRPMDNKRDAERIPILGDLQGDLVVFQAMRVKEISRSGA
jgi:hypothetical protein